MSGWLTVRRGSAPLVLSIPHAGTDIPADIEPPPRLPVARPQRHRLVGRPALRVRRRRTRCHDRSHGDLADGRSTSIATPRARRSTPARRPPSFARPRRSTASHFIRAATRPTRPKSSDARRSGSHPITRPCRPSSSGSARLHDQRRALRRPLDPLVDPAAVRGALTTLQYRHERRSELCTRTDGRGRGRLRCNVVQPRHQRTVPGRLYHPPSWPSATGCACDPDGARLPRLSALNRSGLSTRQTGLHLSTTLTPPRWRPR